MTRIGCKYICFILWYTVLASISDCFLYQSLMYVCSRRDVVVSLWASQRKVWSLKLYGNNTGIRQEGHPELKVLCSLVHIWFESKCVVVDKH